MTEEFVQHIAGSVILGCALLVFMLVAVIYELEAKERGRWR